NGRSRRRRRGRRGGRSRHREGATAPDGSVIAGSPADPTAEQPDIDPSFRPHGGRRDLPVRRRDDPALDTPDHGVTSQGITWEIVGETHEPDPVPEPEAEPETAAQEMPLPPAELEPEPVAATESAPAEKAPAREAAIGNGSLALAETAQKETAPQEPAEPEGPPRRGWWQRRFGGD